MINKIRWKKEEIDEIKSLITEGNSITSISRILNRSYYSTSHKINRLGLKHHLFESSFKPIIGIDIAYVLGAWFGDRTSPKKLGIFVKDKDFVTNFHNHLVKILNRKINIKQYGNRFFVQRIDKKFANWIKAKSPTDIKEFIISGGNKAISNFLKGFFDAEGTVIKRYAQVNQKQKEILVVCKDLLNILNITSYLSKERNRELYILRIEKLSSLIRFYNLVGFNIERKRIKLRDILINKTKIHRDYLEKYDKFKEFFNNKKLIDIAKEVGISPATSYNWAHGKLPLLAKNNLCREDIYTLEYK